MVMREKGKALEEREEGRRMRETEKEGKEGHELVSNCAHWKAKHRVRGRCLSLTSLQPCS